MPNLHLHEYTMILSGSGTINEYRAAFPDKAGLEMRLDQLEKRQFKYLSMLAGFMTGSFALAVAALIKAYG